MRPTLCDEALRLGRILAALTPRESEVHGLCALMELQSSRLAARSAQDDGSPILLLDQDRSQWDPVHIMRGLSALDQAQARASDLGPYGLQAAIAACHVRADTPEATDWVQIAGLYEQLARRTGSPVVEVNRAVALGMAYGPEAGLELLDQLSEATALQGYHLLPSVRGDLLEKLGRHEEATVEFARAATMTHNEPERALLLDRACGRS
jgi:predicted RNA polymerase sigma factor